MTDRTIRLLQSTAVGAQEEATGDDSITVTGSRLVQPGMQDRLPPVTPDPNRNASNGADGSVLSLALLSGALPAIAQTPVEWERPEAIRQGAEPMHATFAGFDSRSAAMVGEVRTSRYHLSLDGDWRFRLSPKMSPA